MPIPRNWTTSCGKGPLSGNRIPRIGSPAKEAGRPLVQQPPVLRRSDLQLGPSPGGPRAVGNDTERTGPVEVEGRASSAAERPRTCSSKGRGLDRAWRAPIGSRRSQVDTRLRGQVRRFPFLLRNEKTDFIECVRARNTRRLRTPRSAIAQARCATGLYRLSVGARAAMDPVKEEFPATRRPTSWCVAGRITAVDHLVTPDPPHPCPPITPRVISLSHKQHHPDLNFNSHTASNDPYGRRPSHGDSAMHAPFHRFTWCSRSR